MVFRRVMFYGCSGRLPTVQEGYMLFKGVIWMFRRVVYCSGGLYAVPWGYMMFSRVIWMFSVVICCSGGLYAVHEGYFMKKIMKILVATNVIASRTPER